MERESIPIEEAILQRLYLDFGEGIKPAFRSDTKEPYYIYELIEEYNKISQNTIETTIYAKPFIQGHRHKLFDVEQIKRIKNLKSQGMSNRKIAKIMKCSEGTIRNYLKQTT